MRRPRRRVTRAKLERLFLRGWSFALLRRWYGLTSSVAQELLRRRA